MSSGAKIASDKKSVEIRPFPYPYKAGFAICNDLDAIRDFAEMKAIHDVLNGQKDTPCGPGLGLEIGDSLHFFTVHPEQDDTWAYFNGLSNLPGKEASALRDGIKSGLLDTVHTWGNYSQKGGFVREQAIWAVEELNCYGLTIPLWVNHGDRHNFQNLGRADSLGDVKETASRRGDKSRVLEYHADLTRQIGIKYVWIKDLTAVIGQERKFDWQDWAEHGAQIGKSFAKGLLTNRGGASAGEPLQVSNKLIRQAKLRDGSAIYEMLRYGDYGQDGADYLPQLLSLKFLRRLTEVGGACLLYLHLGKGRPSPQAPFSKESYAALERLAERYRGGDIWVTTASQLCRYIELRQRLHLTAYQQDGEAIIEGEFIPAGDLPDPELEGLSFYMENADSCKMRLRNSQGLPLEQNFLLVRNPSGHAGKESFSMPLKPFEYPW